LINRNKAKEVNKNAMLMPSMHYTDIVENSIKKLNVKELKATSKNKSLDFN